MIPVGVLEAGGSARAVAFTDSGSGQIPANGFSTVGKTVNIGAADPNRYVIVCVGLGVANAASFAAKIGTVGLNGTAMTRADAAGSAAAVNVGIFYMKVPSGTTAPLTISGDYINDIQHIQYTVYTLTNPQNAVPTYVTTSLPTWNLGPSQYAVFGVSAWQSDNTMNITWSPSVFVENTDQTLFGGNPFYKQIGAASGNAATGTITPQASSTGSPPYGQYKAIAWI